MFLAIPLETRPTWRNPPWMTLLLILINVIIFYGPQRAEEKQSDKAHAYYFDSALPDIELPAYVEFLQRNKSRQSARAEKLLNARAGVALLEMMEGDDSFAAQLRPSDNTQALLTSASPQYASWQTARQRYLTLKPNPFTSHWAQKYGDDLLDRPITWVTAIFLHASTGHLIGNMVFLFLFGFSVEIALGRAQYLTFYLLGGIGSSALSSIAYADSFGYGLGASGAISCVMVLYALLYKLRTIKFFYLVLFYFNYVRAPALILVPLWILNELLSWAFVNSNVGYAAHLGGMLTGLILAKWMPAQKEMDKALASVAPQGINVAPDFAAKAQMLVGKMQWVAACEAWQQAVEQSPNNVDLLRRYFNTARHTNQPPLLRLAVTGILGCRSGHHAILELQRECWRWCNKQTVNPLVMQEPLLLAMAQRWITVGYSPDTDALLHHLRPAIEVSGLWLDTVERYAKCLLKSEQREQAKPWLDILSKHEASGVDLNSPLMK